MGDMAVASASPQRRGKVVGEVVLLRHVDWIRVLSQGREREVTRQSIRVSVISPVVVVGVVGISSVVCAVVSALPVSVGEREREPLVALGSPDRRPQFFCDRGTPLQRKWRENKQK